MLLTKFGVTDSESDLRNLEACGHFVNYRIYHINLYSTGCQHRYSTLKRFSEKKTQMSCFFDGDFFIQA